MFPLRAGHDSKPRSRRLYVSRPTSKRTTQASLVLQRPTVFRRRRPRRPEQRQPVRLSIRTL